MPEPEDTPAAPSSAPRRSFLRVLFSAQESGLVIVIALMMLALTLFGGTKLVTERQSIPEGSSVIVYDTEGSAHQPGSLPQRLLDRIVVTTPDGQELTYSNAWRYDEPNGAPALFTDVQKNKFFEKHNLVQIARDASFFAVMAVGMTAVIILAGIDLSVGSIYALSAIVGAIAMNSLGPDANGILAVLVGVAVCTGIGALCGLANGAMTVGLRVHPFVITLGMMAALRGLTIIIPQKIYGEQSITGFPESFTSGFFKLDIAGVYPVPPIIMLVVALIGWFVLSRTVFGRRVFAIGGNETAARYAGIPVGRVKILVYTIMGALAGLSACMYIGYYGSAETGAGMAYELQVIAAAVIGGASLMGGRGSALGAVLGAIVIKLIDNAMIIFEIDQSWNQVVMGSAIIVAVVVDQAKRRISGS